MECLCILLPPGLSLTPNVSFVRDVGSGEPGDPPRKCRCRRVQGGPSCEPAGGEGLGALLGRMGPPREPTQACFPWEL